jgi:hypothetical protein
VWWPRSRIAPIQNYGLFTRGGGGSCLFGGRRGYKSLGSFFGNRPIKCEEEGEAGKTVFLDGGARCKELCFRRVRSMKGEELQKSFQWIQDESKIKLVRFHL